eukprot:115910-Pyramimonas_sp.AAC.1
MTVFGSRIEGHPGRLEAEKSVGWQTQGGRFSNGVCEWGEGSALQNTKPYQTKEKQSTTPTPYRHRARAIS